MSEGNAGGSVMDAKQFIYLPRWVKIGIMGATAVLLLLAAFSVYQALTSHAHGEAIVFFLSVAQSAALVLIFFLIATFSRRDANVDQLHLLTDEFLRKYISESLKKVSIPALRIENFAIHDEGAKDIFGRLLRMENGDYKFDVWVGLNVKRLFVIYFIPVRDELSIEKAKKIFEFTFGGAEKVGFQANYEEAKVNGENILSIWLTADTDEDLLSNPQEKLFWAQDIAMMTESFLRTANRNNLDLKLNSSSPGPL